MIKHESKQTSTEECYIRNTCTKQIQCEQSELQKSENRNMNNDQDSYSRIVKHTKHTSKGKHEPTAKT